MDLHEFRMTQVDFSGYHLGLNHSIVTDEDCDIKEGNGVLLTEVYDESEQPTGRYLTMKVNFVKRHYSKSEKQTFLIVDLETTNLKGINFRKTFSQHLNGSKEKA